MNRKNIYSNHDGFVGWFDENASKKIASYTKWSGAYKYGKILLATKSGKLLVNEWTNSGLDTYRFADKQKEIAEILSHICDDEEKELDSLLSNILNKYEL